MTDFRSRSCRSLGVLLLLVAGTLFSAPGHAAYEIEPQVTGKQIAPTASSVNASLPTLVGAFSSSSIASIDPNSKALLRLESSWSLDGEDSSQFLRVGDAVSQPGSWGSAVRFAGIHYGTKSELRSDLFNGDRLALVGVSVLPSTADALFAQAADASLKQRGLSIKGKPVAGANALAFTARDATGHNTTFTRPLLAKQSAAPVGCKQFSTGIGRARQNYAIESNDYGALYANTSVTCGTNDGYTVEAHGEYLAGDAGLVGMGLMRSVGNFGSASFTVATSQADDSGWLVRAGLQHTSDRFDLSLRARLQSAEFRELGTSSTADPMTSRILASVATKLTNRNSVALAYANQTTVTAQRVEIVALSQTIQLGNEGSKGSFFIIADRAVSDDTSSSVKISYVRAFQY